MNQLKRVQVIAFSLMVLAAALVVTVMVQHTKQQEILAELSQQAVQAQKAKQDAVTIAASPPIRTEPAAQSVNAPSSKDRNQALDATPPAGPESQSSLEVCKIIEEKLMQAKEDNYASLKSAWDAIESAHAFADKEGKHADFFSEFCRTLALTEIQGTPASVLEAHNIPVEPATYWLFSDIDARLLQDAIEKYPEELLARLEDMVKVMMSARAHLLPNFVKVEVGRYIGNPVSGSWEPTATITNRAYAMSLANINVSVQGFDSNKTMVWEGFFHVSRLDGGGKALVHSIGPIIPGNADVAHFTIGDVQLTVLR